MLVYSGTKMKWIGPYIVVDKSEKMVKIVPQWNKSDKCLIICIPNHNFKLELQLTSNIISQEISARHFPRIQY